MDKIAKKAFKTLRNIKSVSVATISDGSPQNRIMDVMLNQNNSLYFITARGKPVYTQLKKTQQVAICALDKDYNMIRIKGQIRFCKQKEIVDRIFEKNPILNKIYPNNKKEILEAFHLFKGSGEIFELSKSPIKRTQFTFGGEKQIPLGYVINSNCVACGKCIEVCPDNAIIKSENNTYSINKSTCIECGACYEICPVEAIDLPKKF